MRVRALLALGPEFEIRSREDYERALANWKELTISARRQGEDARAAELSWAKEMLRTRWATQRGSLCACGKRKYQNARRCPTCRLKSHRPGHGQISAECLDEKRTGRLRTVLKMRTEGMHFGEIASVLGITRKGVEYHWAQIQRRTGLRDLALLTQWGLKAKVTEWKVGNHAMAEI